MNLHSRTSTVIILSALVFFMINEVLSYSLALKEEIHSSYEKDKLILKNLFTAQEKYLSTIAKILAADDVVLRAYRENKPKILQKHIEPIWKELQADKLIYEIHFFKPPAISFVNFSNFKSIGQDVSKIRKDILWVTSSFKESSHVLMCRTYAGYRTTEPIVDVNATMLGGLSLGKKVDWIPSVIKEKTSHDSFLVYKKNSPNSLHPKYYKDFMKDKIVFNDFILADKTIDITISELLDIDFSKKIQNIEINGKDYTLFSYPIIDFNEDTMGYLCSIAGYEKFNEQFIYFSIKEVVIIFFTAFIFLYIGRQRNHKLLNYINHIKDITTNIKKRNFKILHQKDIYMKEIKIDSLDEIEENIVKMGLSLEEQYLLLEDDNRVKSEQLIIQLYTDDVTGLGNRNALLRDIDSYKNSFVTILNVRGFKNINDVFGFKVGNQVLQELSEKYKEILGDEWLIYRVSNDEFALLNKNTLSEKEFISLVDKTIEEIDKTVFIFHGIDIGLNLYSGISLDQDDKLAKAIVALNKAKERRVKYIIYSKDNDTKEVQAKNIEMTNEISYALRHDNIVPYFQGIVDRNGKIFKYEALVRMINREHEVVSPFFFLEISKKTNMYIDITKTVIEKTFEKFKNSDKQFSINLTAIDILNPEVIALIDEKLQSFKNIEQVVFELVESDDLYNLKEIGVFLQFIKEKGAKIAIDDFGTGYSNFSYIIEMKPDYLKIDGSLIKNIDTDMTAYKTVQTIINFAHDLDILIVAEFIHNKEVFDICVALGVDEFQGYYFSEPQEDIV